MGGGEAGGPPPPPKGRGSRGRVGRGRLPAAGGHRLAEGGLVDVQVLVRDALPDGGLPDFPGEVAPHAGQGAQEHQVCGTGVAQGLGDSQGVQVTQAGEEVLEGEFRLRIGGASAGDGDRDDSLGGDGGHPRGLQVVVAADGLHGLQPQQGVRAAWLDDRAVDPAPKAHAGDHRASPLGHPVDFVGLDIIPCQQGGPGGDGAGQEDSLASHAAHEDADGLVATHGSLPPLGALPG